MKHYFRQPLGRVYSNTFLAILNSRQSFQTVLDVEDFSSNQAIPGVSNKQPDSSTFTQASNAAAITHFEPSTMTSGTTAGHTGTSIITEPDRSRSSMALTEIESLQFSAYSDSVYNGSVIGRNSGSMDINIIN
ncbi:hypothetical protein D9757_005144 [Collybiopsis confluens]|uniref:Uncharacterized protein n=1 Tax=Collybiopsis confluens TaxID=2823264 RepID=A0A8H5MC33_9AGAR|nr:hypothetical protein D9757_005144 [Collybiopsis confluens]